MTSRTERLATILFDDDADNVKTWKGLALSAIADLVRYAEDESPARRFVSADAYIDDALRLARPDTVQGK